VIKVGVTTEEQLLRESSVRLPIVDVGLPLVAFDWITPRLVPFHVQLPLQLCLLGEKLHRRNTEIRQLPGDPQGGRRATLSRFVFGPMLVRDHRHRFGCCRRWQAEPPLRGPARRGPAADSGPVPAYHGAFTTWWQRFLIAVGLLLLWLL
jgi:hypothetical protein